MHKNFFSTLDGLGGYYENIISNRHNFSLVGVCKSIDEMIPHRPYEPFDGMIALMGRWP